MYRVDPFRCDRRVFTTYYVFSRGFAYFFTEQNRLFFRYYKKVLENIRKVQLDTFENLEISISKNKLENNRVPESVVCVYMIRLKLATIISLTCQLGRQNVHEEEN